MIPPGLTLCSLAAFSVAVTVVSSSLSSNTTRIRKGVTLLQTVPSLLVVVWSAVKSLPQNLLNPVLYVVTNLALASVKPCGI